MAALVLAIALMGCSSAPERQLSREPVAPYATLPNGNDPLNPSELVSPAIAEGMIPHYEDLRGHALNVLELSGGGQYGAFGAGFLKGWRQTGIRPEFDVVTGVSTGALLATHAFLGTPADDAVLEEIFTNISARDIYTKKSFLGLLFGGSSYYDTTPLKGLLDKYITEETLARVAAAHDRHRRLLIGTTNLDYQQTWVWNMGLIAKRGDAEALELYKKVLRASAAPPIAFPPIEIEGYLFADGGVRQNIVVVGLAGKDPPQSSRHGSGTVFVIHNGQSESKPTALRNDALHIAGPTLDTMMTNSMHGLLLRSYYAAKARKYRFRLVAIPDDVDVGDNALAFDPKQMQDSFDVGYALGQRPDPWQRQPVSLGDIPEWALEPALHRD